MLIKINEAFNQIEENTTNNLYLKANLHSLCHQPTDQHPTSLNSNCTLLFACFKTDNECSKIFIYE